MRKTLTILAFIALGYGLFWFLALNRSPKYPQGIAWEFGRALALRDTAAVQELVIDGVAEDLARLRRELATHPGGPVDGLAVPETETAPGSSETTRNIIFYNAGGVPLMTVTAHMRKGPEGWKIDGLALMSH
jgi:hypothetical protein